MLTFIALALALTILALAVVIAPALLARRAGTEEARAKTNVAILAEQFRDLERDHATGIITDEVYQESREDLEHRVLEESRADAGDADVAFSLKRRWTTFACLGAMLPILGFYFYTILGTPNANDLFFIASQKAMAEAAQAGGHSEQELSDQILALEARLKEQPDNVDGWWMLAHAKASLGDYMASVAAYERLDKLLPGNPDVLADWADTLAAARNGSLVGEPKALVERALQANPLHAKALALLGTAYFNDKDYTGAIRYWSILRDQTERGSSGWEQITANIEEAKQLGGVLEKIESMRETRKGKPSGALSARLEGTVRLSDDLKDKVGSKDTVFVFARTATGSKMPVAFLRSVAGSLPLRFVLDSNSPMGGGMRTLADVKEVFVQARISKTGNFMPSPGDLEGAIATPVTVGSTGIDLVINRIVP